MKPAEKVLKKFKKVGIGPGKLAKLMDVERTQIYKWTYPREKGGRGGVIPYHHHKQLLKISKKHGAGVEISDFMIQ